MKIIAVIPARYQSTRFPGKLLEKIKNKTIISQVYDNIKKAAFFHDVLVATDNTLIFDHLSEQNATVVMTSDKHKSGSDRIAEVIQNIECDAVVNVQGDEPFLTADVLTPLVKAFEDNTVSVASMMHKLDSKDIHNPNFVKVVTDKKRNALYFSRAPIPWNRDNLDSIQYYRHIGVYAYRKKALLQFVKWQEGNLEKIEKLEQLRFLENNIAIRMITTEYDGFGIDTPADLSYAKKILD